MFRDECAPGIATAGDSAVNMEEALAPLDSVTAGQPHQGAVAFLNAIY